MTVTAYFLSHGHWTVIPHQLEENFKDMIDCGFTAVAISFCESEMVYSRRAFEIQLNLAHKAGLKVFVIPSRLGNRFAGAPLMPSLWLDQHPEAQVPGYLGWSGPMACTESSVFRAWIAEFMTAFLNDYAIDGIIWDEPKSEGLVSTHPETISKFGASPTRQNMEDGFNNFLTELTAHCRSIRPDLTITLFNSAKSTEYFTSKSVRIPGLDYAGYDGNLCRQSFFHEEPKWHKYRLESVYERTLAECRAAKVGTFALVENMTIPKEAIPEYRENLAAFLQKLRFDHLALYYYAHNNEDPETVHRITRELMQKNL